MNLHELADKWEADAKRMMAAAETETRGDPYKARYETMYSVLDDCAEELRAALGEPRCPVCCAGMPEALTERIEALAAAQAATEQHAEWLKGILKECIKAFMERGLMVAAEDVL